MFDVADLTTGGRYAIAGERGEWHYSGVSGNCYRFWRWAENQPNRRVSLTLSRMQAQQRVWQQVQKLDLSNLEAFRGQ